MQLILPEAAVGVSIVGEQNHKVNIHRFARVYFFLATFIGAMVMCFHFYSDPSIALIMGLIFGVGCGGLVVDTIDADLMPFYRKALSKYREEQR